MLSKAEIRLRLNYISKYLKISRFAAEFGLSQSTVSRFMKESTFDYMISLETANNFYKFIVNKSSQLHNIDYLHINKWLNYVFSIN